MAAPRRRGRRHRRRGVVERRIGGFYELGEWAGHVLARVPAGMAVPAEDLVAMLATGRPMWRSREVIAALSELWT